MSGNPYTSCLLNPNTPKDIQLHCVTGKNFICKTGPQQQRFSLTLREGFWARAKELCVTPSKLLFLS